MGVLVDALPVPVALAVGACKVSAGAVVYVVVLCAMVLAV